ncbi:MAG: hypothetical protein PS018_19820 [bacterium]|nr:hypothetical protein [bacterium]
MPVIAFTFDGLRRHAYLVAAGSTVLLAAVLFAQPSAAQKFHASEPLMMDPYSTIYVNDGSCSAGKVLKVQGAARNHRRKKSCVPVNEVPGARDAPRAGTPK